MPAGPQIDLVVLVPDKHMEATLRALLQRHASLRVRRFNFEILVHPRRDPGCRAESSALLSVYLSRAAHALVLFDRDGCGEEDLSREELEAKVQAALSASGWESRSAVVVIDPELESWVWSDSPVVDQTVGWAGFTPALRQWLLDKGHLAPGQQKPPRPKEAFEAALRERRKRQSASLFAELAAKVSLSRCVDPAFQKLKLTLVSWFRS